MISRYGELAILIDTDSAAHSRYLAAAARTVDGVMQAVPSATSVLVEVTGASALHAVTEWAGSAIQQPVPAESEGRLVTIPVHYGGPDLAEIGDILRWSPRQVVQVHCEPTYIAAFAGFAPGFVYLEGLDPALQLPRRTTPRTRVPAGAVGIGHGYTAVYPRQSPGGWNLLGDTDAVLFDLDRERPALIEPGDRVRFVPA